VALRVTAVAESPAKLLVLSRTELAVARLVAGVGPATDPGPELTDPERAAISVVRGVLARMADKERS
jgi:hypothetical protein